MNINVSGSAAPKLALVPARHYNSDVKKVPSFIRIERGSYGNLCPQAKQGADGAHGLKVNKGIRFAKKLADINVSRSAVPKLAFVTASRYNFDVK